MGMIHSIAVEGDDHCLPVGRILPRINNVRVRGGRTKLAGKDAVGSDPIEHHVESKGKTALTGFLGKACDALICITTPESRMQPRRVARKENAATMSRLKRGRYQDGVEPQIG
jgi:hypothetical protein